jgi:hypothetical protein
VVTDIYIDTAEGRFYLRDLAFANVKYYYAYPARTVASFCAAIELLIAIPVALMYGSVGPIGAGLLAAVGMGGALLRDDRRNPRLMELTAMHCRTSLVLFRSVDKTEFEQVRRAVIRAVEAHRHRSARSRTGPF